NSLMELRMRDDLSGFEIAPGLAESHEQPDPQTYTFTLAPSIATHDKPPTNGRLLTAEDVVENLRLIASAPENVRSRFIRAFNFEGYESIDAIDERTVQIKFSTPFSPFLTYVA